LIVLGDFNMTDLNDDHAAIDRFLRDAYRDAGNGLGLTHALRWRGIDLPRWMRLDYIFTGSGLEPLEARVMPISGGSDHAPVWARLEFYDPTASYPP
jgi:endonuclease/exonuclease/phosphatase family metal-dependent hydrolase